MNAETLQNLIQDLVDQEQCLDRRTGLSAREQSLRDRIGIELDRSWYILWQRHTLPQPGKALQPIGGGTLHDYWW